ncbi:MAG: CarD family transcriptional regulator, partial [Gaiellaceae bacterium]
MDRPTSTETTALTPIARVLAEGDRMRELLDDPGETRVSEPILPLFLAALHLARGGPLVCVLPDDAQARDAAEGASWFLGEERVGLFASRGVRWGSGHEPPPHLLGERARALEVLAAGGLVCASALGAAEGIPPESSRPEPIVLRGGDEPGVEGLAEHLALAGYERVAQAEERGQFAVRGGIVDVFPSTGREPVRVELFGDEIESLRAFSPFTQRTLHELDEATVYPAAERLAGDLEPMLVDEEAGEAPPIPADLVAPLPPPHLVWQADEVEEVVREELGATLELGDALRVTQLPAGQRHSFEAQRPAVAARGLSEAERDLLAFVRGGNRVVVTFAHLGEALRTKALLRRLEAVVVEPGEALPEEPGLVFAVSPARRGFVLRDLGIALLPDTQVFRKRPPRADVRVGRALQSFADLRTGDYVVHEDHGVGQLLGFETKTVAGVTRDYLFLAFRGDDRLYVPHEQIAKVSRYVGADGHAPALSKLGGKAWQTIKSRARAGAHELAGELLALYAQRQRAEGLAYEADNELVEQLEASFPFEETPDQRVAIEVVKEDLESARPMDRLVAGDVGFGKTEVAVRAAFVAVANSKQVLF